MLFNVLIFNLCSDQQGKSADFWPWPPAHQTMPGWDLMCAESAASLFNYFRSSSKIDQRKIIVSGFKSHTGLVFQFDYLQTATENAHRNIDKKIDGLAQYINCPRKCCSLVESDKSTIMLYRGATFGGFVAMNNIWYELVCNIYFKFNKLVKQFIYL
jgi:hypothetical protein